MPMEADLDAMLNYPKPREGTETRHLASASFLSLFLLNYPKPREGTETHIVATESGVHQDGR